MEKITKERWPEDWSQVPEWTEIDEDIYYHFLNVLPPIHWDLSSGYFQCAEPYNHVRRMDGRYAGQYLTFVRDDGKCWYIGIQFANGHPAKKGGELYVR